MVTVSKGNMLNPLLSRLRDGTATPEEIAHVTTMVQSAAAKHDAAMAVPWYKNWKVLVAVGVGVVAVGGVAYYTLKR